MNRFLFATVFASIGLLSAEVSFSDAGRTAGNGTDVLVCRGRRADRAPAVELVDYFEGREHDELNLPYRRRYASVEDRLDEIFAQSERLDPALTERFRTFAIQFLTLNDVQMSRNPLRNVPDSELEVEPSRCERKQLVIRRTANRRRRKEFLVQETLWRRMGMVQKAGAILNLAFIEVMLERDEDAEISDSARMMNGLWADTDRMQDFNASDYLQEVSQIAPFDSMANPFVNGSTAHPLIAASDFTRNAQGRLGIPASYVSGSNFLPVPRMEGYGIPGDTIIWLSEQDMGEVDWTLTLSTTTPGPRESGFPPIVFVGGIAYNVGRRAPQYDAPLTTTLEVRPASDPNASWELVATHLPSANRVGAPSPGQTITPWDSISARDGRYSYRVTLDLTQASFGRAGANRVCAAFIFPTIADGPRHGLGVFPTGRVSSRSNKICRRTQGPVGNIQIDDGISWTRGPTVVFSGEFQRTAAGVTLSNQRVGP